MPGARAPIEIDRSTTLAASRADVWAVASTMAGVNAELGPFVRMTHPSDRTSLEEQDVPLGVVIFPSWLLAFGVVPFDRHSLCLQSLDPGRGFVEESTSWLQKRWRHERTITDRSDGAPGCVVTDHLVVVPRLGPTAPLARRIVGALFTHRHRQLAKRFGPGAPSD